MKDEGSAGATVENTHEPLAEEAGRKAGLADLSEGAWDDKARRWRWPIYPKNFNGWAMEASPAGIEFMRICNGRPNEVYRLVTPAAAAVYAAAISQDFEPPRALRDQDKPAG